MENKFKEGDVVCALVNLHVHLVIRRYVGRIYYCRVKNDPNREFVYFERELAWVQG